MRDDGAFLRAIAADPADDTTRLVYADWLEERGDPRGEYIRIRAEIDRAAPHTEQYAALRTRLKVLREHIDPAWAKARVIGPGTAPFLLPRHGNRSCRTAFPGRRHRSRRPGKAVLRDLLCCRSNTILPERRSERWRLIEEFIENWHRPLDPKDGCSEAELRGAEQRLGCKLPIAVREWLALAGRRPDVWSSQDHLHTPDRLWIDTDSDTLIVRSENQGCEFWGIRIADLGQDDPPIMEVYAGVQASPTTTAFACLVLLYEAFFAGAIWAGGEIQNGQVRASATRGLIPCDLPDRYWVTSPLRLFEGTDLIVGYHGGSWVYVTARGEEAYLQLEEEVREQLEVYW